MRKLTTYLLASIVAATGYSQNYQACPPNVVFTDNCATACLVCGIPDPIFINNGGFTYDFIPEDCLELHNSMWFAFMAVEPQVTFTAIPSNCNTPFAIQMAMYETCTGPCITMDYGCGGVPVTVTMPDLEVGKIYLIVVDGCGGTICDIQFFVEPPSAIQIPPVTNTEPISGPSPICTNGTFTYCIPEPFWVTSYEWTVPSGVLVNGNPGPKVVLPASSGGCADITVGPNPGPVQICVRPSNPCSAGMLQCKTIDVQRIPTTVLPEERVCREEAGSYLLPWGDNLNPATGIFTYQHQYTTEAGCDSLVKLTVVVPPTPLTILPPQGLCPGECFTLGDEQLCNPGTHTVKLTSSTGCDSMVQLNLLPVYIDASILPADTFTCNTTGITLNAIHIPNAIHTWTNVNGTLLGSADSVIVTQPGTYFHSVTRTQTNATCTLTDTVIVRIDSLPPAINVSADTLGCGMAVAAIHVSSATLLASYEWEGPGGFSAEVPDTTVHLPGLYSVTVTDLVTGCSDSRQVTVHTSLSAPELNTFPADTLDCNTSSVSLIIQAPHAVNYEWSGPNGFASSLSQPQVNTPGSYSITIRDSSGCINQAQVSVFEDHSAPTVFAFGDTLSCAIPTGIVQADVGAGTASFEWSGPAGYSATVANPVVSHGGDYTVVATGDNGCTASATVSVWTDMTPPDLSLQAGVLNCSPQETWIQVQSSVSNPVVQWSGPAGFQSTMSTDSVSIPGIYVATVSGANGCTASASIQVMQDDSAPDVYIAGDTLSCAAGTAQLIANAGAPGLIFSWTGPQGFSAATDTLNVTAPGTYNLTVTDPANGCASVSAFEVPEDQTAPVISAEAGVISCAETTAILQAQSVTNGMIWQWTGPGGFSATGETVSTNLPGLYQLSGTSPVNGCTATVGVQVQTDTLSPTFAIQGADTLNCSVTQLTLAGTANAPLQWTWTAPDGSQQQGNLLTAQTPGVYMLIGTGTNGCTASATALVHQDIAGPIVQAAGDTLDCLTGGALLSGQSSSTIQQWHWTGPGNFEASVQNPVVSLPGIYTLTALGSNGCPGTASAVVAQNSDLPQVQIIGNQTLTCTTTSVTLTANIPQGANGQWSTGLATNQLTIQAPGDYTFSATGANGCINNVTVQVVQDITPPQNVSAHAGTLDCNTTTTNLTGVCTTGNVNWSWSGPGNYTSFAQNPIDVTLPGLYSLTVTNAVNGCSAGSSTTVSADFTVPQFSATADTLTCSQQQASIQTDAVTPGLGFQWAGPGGFTSALEDPSVNLPGQYSVTTTAANGCTAVLSVSVVQNNTPPDVVVSGDTLDCNTPSGALLAIASVPGVQFLWSGPDGFSSTAAAPAITRAGVYTLTATDPSTGCSASKQILVIGDFVPPVLSATGGLLDCRITEVTLTAVTNSGVQLSWSGPGNFQSVLSQPTVGVAGAYVATATGANGCVSTSIATVEADTAAPVFSIAQPPLLDCNTAEVLLQAVVQSPPPFAATWTTNDGHLTGSTQGISASADSAGHYTLILEDLQNGCTAALTVQVMRDSNIPEALVLLKQDVSCYGNNDGVIEVASVTGGTDPVLFALDNGDFSARSRFEHLTPGVHVIRLQDASGCTLEAEAALLEPDLLTVKLGPDTTITLGSPITLLTLSAVSEPQRVAEFTTSPVTILHDSLLYPLHSFKYKLWVRDAHNCTAFDEQVIRVNRNRNIYIPNIFRPASGVQNDVLGVFGGPDVRKVKSFRIFDRWGDQVHASFEFIPDGIAGAWDGRFNDRPVTPGVFVYVAEIEFVDGETEVFKGDVTVIR